LITEESQKEEAMLSRIRYWFGAIVFIAICAGHCGLLPAQAASPQDKSADASKPVTMRDLHNASTVSVTEYGAVGNCSLKGSAASCTDDASAIQSAIDHCFSAGCAVYFPAAPEAKSITIYYVSHSINPKGVSMTGPPGGAGAIALQPTVAVRGAPGKDVFAVGDPAASGYVKPLQRFAIRDLGIIVDDTVDASSSGSNSFPNRLPGRTVFDAAMEAGSATLTSNTAYFQPGDVGQNVIVYGAGGNLSTTISEYASRKQVTLATSASATVSAAHAYISVMSLAATQTIGNCAFTYDASAFSGAENTIGSTESDFTNISVETVSRNSHQNNVCAFFFQGDAGTYADRWEHDNIRTHFGFVFAPANAVAPGPMCAGICDFNVFDHLWINSIYPFVAYGGGFNRLQEVQLSIIQQGPNILDGDAPGPYPKDWYFDIPEEEDSSTNCPPGWMAYRIAGESHYVNRLGTPYCKTPMIGLQWDASESTVTSLQFNSLSSINVSGTNNAFKTPLGDRTWTDSGTVWNVTGYGNTWITCTSSNPFERVQTGRCQYAGLNPAGVGPAQLSRGAIAFDRTHDFIDKGANAYFLNGEDLWFWPPEVGAIGGAPTLVNDPESDTGSAINLAQGTASKVLNESNDIIWKVGSEIPAGPMRIYFKAKTTGQSADFYVDALYGDPTLNNSLGCKGAVTLKATYGVFYCDVNASAAIGNRFGIQLGKGQQLAADVEIAWIAIRPWTTDLPTESLQIGSGTAITGNQGNGSNLLHSTGKATPGDLIAFDENGNAVDSGVPARGGARAGGEGGEADPANPGDLLCAHAADKTIHAISITGSPACNGTTCTLTGSAIPADYAIPGQLVGVTGTSGVAGLNGGPYEVTSYRPGSVTFYYNAAKGTPWGGTFYRWCENQDADATAMTVFSRTLVQIPANSLEKHMNYQHRAQMLLTTAAAAPEFSVQMSYGPASLYRASYDVSADQVNNPSQLTVNMLALAVGDSGVIESSLQSFTLTGSNSTYADPGIQTSDTSVDQPIQVNAAFSATGVASVASASGGSISGAGTCNLTGFNGDGAGAAVTVTFTQSGSWAGAAFAVSDTGHGYKSAPTTAVLSSVTAKCSGTVNLVTQIGGAQGNAVELVGLQ
jgi:hypothetical protein